MPSNKCPSQVPNGLPARRSTVNRSSSWPQPILRLATTISVFESMRGVEGQNWICTTVQLQRLHNKTLPLPTLHSILFLIMSKIGIRFLNLILTNLAKRRLKTPADSTSLLKRSSSCTVTRLDFLRVLSANLEFLKISLKL